MILLCIPLLNKIRQYHLVDVWGIFRIIVGVTEISFDIASIQKRNIFNLLSTEELEICSNLKYIYYVINWKEIVWIL